MVDTQFHRFVYLQYLTDWLYAHKDTFWPILNKTARIWLEKSPGKVFHDFVIDEGFADSEHLSFARFMKEQYRNPNVMQTLLRDVADMEHWSRDTGIAIPDEYRGI